MSESPHSHPPDHRPNWRLFLLYCIALAGLAPLVMTLMPQSLAPAPNGLLQVSSMARNAAYKANGNAPDPDASMGNGSPALNQAYNNAKRLEQLANESGKPSNQAILREISTDLYQLSVAQAGYEYLNGNEAMGELIHAAKGNPVPDSTANAVKNVKTWRDKLLQSVHKLNEQHPELPAELKAIAQGMAMDVIRRTNQQYGSLLN